MSGGPALLEVSTGERGAGRRAARLGFDVWPLGRRVIGAIDWLLDDDEALAGEIGDLPGVDASGRAWFSRPLHAGAR
jgi:hypothetical protein